MKFDAQFRSRRSNVMATRGMVATSQPLAAQAGLTMLQAGGNAADAAIATGEIRKLIPDLVSALGGELVMGAAAAEPAGDAPASRETDLATASDSAPF